MDKTTERFLARCAEVGYTRISIETAHPKIPNSVDFPFGPEDSVFAYPGLPCQGPRIDDQPAIWAVLEEFGISGSCGNAHQHDLKLHHLDIGAYYLKGGKWLKYKDG